MLGKRAANATGRPLSASDWLAAHHQAKLEERRAYCAQLAALNPASIVDVGCGTGLWLGELDHALDPSCKLTGVDADAGAIRAARQRSRGWRREVDFQQMDVDAEPGQLPEAELTLLFNVAPYLRNPERLLATVAERGGKLAVRQYDGALLRVGPMSQRDRAIIDASLAASVQSSEAFRHYDLDRVFELLQHAAFERREVRFESFGRTAPFPPEFVPYVEGHLDWVRELLSDDASERLDLWRESGVLLDRGYFVGVDMVALLS